MKGVLIMTMKLFGGSVTELDKCLELVNRLEKLLEKKIQVTGVSGEGIETTSLDSTDVVFFLFHQILPNEIQYVLNSGESVELFGVSKKSFIDGNPLVIKPYPYSIKSLSCIPITYHNVCERRDEQFTGRLESLKEIEDNFQKAIPQVITGIGGIGKTSLAIEYIHQYRSRYRLIYFLHGKNLAEEICELLGAFNSAIFWETKLNMGFVAKNYNVKQLQNIIKQVLKQLPSWLIIFDDIHDKIQIEAYLPEELDRENHNLLITSRSACWDKPYSVIKLHPLNPEDSLKFLALVTPKSKKEELLSLIELVGVLPLNLLHAGTYLARYHINFVTYKSIYQSELRHGRVLGDNDRSFLPHHNKVAEVWLDTLKEIKLYPLAWYLLQCCAFLALQFPKELFLNQKRLATAEEVESAFMILFDYSLLSYHQESKMVTLLPFLQMLIRNNLSIPESLHWAKKALLLRGRSDLYDWIAIHEVLNKAFENPRKPSSIDSLTNLCLWKIQQILENEYETIEKQLDSLPIDLLDRLEKEFTLSSLIKQHSIFKKETKEAVDLTLYKNGEPITPKVPHNSIN